MNIKMKELAKLANFNEQDIEDMSPEFEKFYELIVNSSVECVRDVLRNESSDLTYKATNEVQERIRDFFGLKNNI